MRLVGKYFVAGTLCIAFVSGAGCGAYLLREYSGGTLLWNRDEAYLFVGVTRQGHHMSNFRYPWFVVKERFGVVELPDDDRASIVVIHVATPGVERHIWNLEDNRPDRGPKQYTPIDGLIYANCPWLGGLCRWSGDHFERASQAEQGRLGSLSRLKATDFDREGGWSRRSFTNKPIDYRFSIQVGDQFRISVMNEAKDGIGVVSIDVLRNGKSPEKIWSLDERPRKVSPAEYQRAFSGRE